MPSGSRTERITAKQARLREDLGWPEDQSDIPQLTDRQVITKFEGKGLDKEHVIREYLWRKK